MGVSAAIVGGAQAVGSIGSAYASAKAQQEQGEYQSTMAQVNSTFAQEQGSEAIAAGSKAAAMVDSKANQTIGSQRAELAAQGIDVDVGSAAQIQTDTRAQAQLNENTIKNNAYLTAWGFKVQATNDSYAGQYAGMAANNMASSTLLTGGMNAINYGANGFKSYWGGSGGVGGAGNNGTYGGGGTPQSMSAWSE